MKNDNNSAYKEKIRQAGNSIHTVLDASGPITNYLYDDFSRFHICKHSHFSKHDHVLDFGCGLGRLSESYASKVRSIVAVDVSEDLIALAEDKSTHQNVSYHVISSLEQVNDCFDKIYIFGVFLHLSDDTLTDVLKHFKRLLKPHGRIVLIEPLVPVRRELKEAAIVYRTSAELEDCFLKNGFEIQVHEKVIRSPSYAFHVLKKVKIHANWSMPIYRWIEKTTINRKPEHAEAYWHLYTFITK